MVGQLDSFWHVRQTKNKICYEKQAYSNILKLLPQQNEKFQIKNSDIFHMSAQKINCGYSLEPPGQGGSN